MSTFNSLKLALQAQIAMMSNHGLFVSKADRETMATTYLASFPQGSNPIFRERTEHDCTCCRQFIKQAGGMLAIIDGQLVSIWDVQVGGAYQVVADAMSALVKSAGIDTVFLHEAKTVGTDKNHETRDGKVITWEHFYAQLPTKAVAGPALIATLQGKAKTNYQTLERSLKEITVEAIDIVTDLVAQNTLYRGQEFIGLVKTLADLKKGFITAPNQVEFVWVNSLKMKDASNIRGTVIGTLLSDLSEGVELEAAVKSYEAKVAPQNYKRPTALVTQRMIDDANKTVTELGLETAFNRRYANLQDITINNVLFADRTVKQALGGLMGAIAPTAPVTLNFDKVAEMPVQDFLDNVLPTALTVEVFVENRHESNLVSLIAPSFPDAGHILKWGNNFSWSYIGEVTDSIKQRVKAAGGNVTGDLCCRLAWDYRDDLDFHMYEPGGGHIYFSTRGRESHYGGQLDVDANGGSGMMDNPVENIFYADRTKMKEGSYELKVNNYNRRSDGVGFDVEIECDGTTHSFNYPKVIKDGEYVDIAVIDYRKGVFTVTGDLNSNQQVKSFWGITTGQFQPVGSIMNSPNHWDGECTGNKHVFFMLKDCNNPDKARGFYNEFLSDNLNQHRKVFEILASKMKTVPTTDQLSGLGFSTTKKDHVICRVTGSFNRMIKVIF